MPNKRVRPWLRVHLLGYDSTAKENMAKSFVSLAKRLHFDDDSWIIVEDIEKQRAKKASLTGIAFQFSVETEYLKIEADPNMRNKHIIFVDSLIDRYIRGSDLGVHPLYSARMKEASTDASSVFLYGPKIDKKRSKILLDYKIPHQIWTSKSCLSDLEALLIVRLGKKNGH